MFDASHGLSVAKEKVFTDTKCERLIEKSMGSKCDEPKVSYKIIVPSMSTSQLHQIQTIAICNKNNVW